MAKRKPKAKPVTSQYIATIAPQMARMHDFRCGGVNMKPVAFLDRRYPVGMVTVNGVYLDRSGVVTVVLVGSHAAGTDTVPSAHCDSTELIQFIASDMISGYYLLNPN